MAAARLVLLALGLRTMFRAESVRSRRPGTARRRRRRTFRSGHADSAIRLDAAAASPAEAASSAGSRVAAERDDRVVTALEVARLHAQCAWLDRALSLAAPATPEAGWLTPTPVATMNSTVERRCLRPASWARFWSADSEYGRAGCGRGADPTKVPSAAASEPLWHAGVRCGGSSVPHVESSPPAPVLHVRRSTVVLAEPQRDLDVGLPHIPLRQNRPAQTSCADTHPAARTTAGFRPVTQDVIPRLHRPAATIVPGMVGTRPTARGLTLDRIHRRNRPARS